MVLNPLAHELLGMSRESREYPEFLILDLQGRLQPTNVRLKSHLQLLLPTSNVLCINEPCQEDSSRLLKKACFMIFHVRKPAF